MSLPENVRQRNLDSRHSVANKNVEMIQRTRFHLDQHFIRANRRLGYVRVLEHFRPAMLFEDSSAFISRLVRARDRRNA